MINGILNVYKEAGFTSHDVVAKLRGICRQKKIGHTGTLDPEAVGVLPVCLGSGTKLCDMLTDKSKEYEAVLLLGQVTDTQDVTGTVLEEHEVTVDEEQAVEAIRSFVGAYEQIPPMYSALKVNGKRLYELARAGKEVERKGRPVEIHSIEILSVSLPEITFRVACSKGTYIRTLCHDIGEKLGCGGCMEELTRTKVSRFTLEDSYTLEEVRQKKEEGTLSEILVPIDEMFEQYEAVTLKAPYEALVCNGNMFFEKHINESKDLVDGEYVRVYSNSGRFIAIYAYQQKQKMFKIVKMFFDKNE